MSLAQLQNKFETIIFSGAKALEDIPSDWHALFAENGIALDEGLSVYQSNVLGNLTKVILDIYPMITALTGEDFATALAKQYAIAHPPINAYLNTYGDSYAAFIKDFAPAQSLPYLPDIARLENALNQSYYAADQDSFTANDLAKIDQTHLGDLKLPLKDSSILLKSPYNLLGLRDFCFNGQESSPPAIEAESGAQYLLALRNVSLENDIKPLREDEHFMLALLSNNETLGIALEQTATKWPDFNIQDFLQTHLDLETFINA